MANEQSNQIINSKESDITRPAVFCSFADNSDGRPFFSFEEIEQ